MYILGEYRIVRIVAIWDTSLSTQMGFSSAMVSVGMFGVLDSWPQTESTDRRCKGITLKAPHRDEP